MAGNLQQRLESLRSKAVLLTQRYAVLLEQKQQADSLIADLQRTLEQQRREMDVMRQQIEHLRVVSTIDPRREDVEMTRSVLNKLVRDIDKCINDLTE